MLYFLMMNKSKKPQGTLLIVAEKSSMLSVLRVKQILNYLPEINMRIVVAGVFDDSCKLEKVSGSHIEPYELPSIVSKSAYDKSIRRNKLPYNHKNLFSALNNDISMIDKVKPDVIVGIGRLTLCVSARVLKIPYINLTNFAWSKFNDTPYPLPVVCQLKWFPTQIARLIFDRTSLVLIKLVLRPINNLRSKYGLKKFSSLRDWYGDGDFLFYCDPGFLFESFTLPENHMFIGALPSLRLWDAKTTPYKQTSRCVTIIWDSEFDDNMRDLLSKTFESMGLSVEVFEEDKLFEELDLLEPKQDFEVQIVDLFKSSHLVVCHGNLFISYSCLFFGTPVLSVPRNIDDLIHFQHLLISGLGFELRPSKLNIKSIKVIMDEVSKKENEPMRKVIEAKTRPFQQIVGSLLEQVMKIAR